MKMIVAKSLRNIDNLRKIPDNPGYYKWWAKKKEFDELLNGLGVDKKTIINDVEIRKDKYCIYVGIAVNESIRNRINWHVNDSHTKERVKNGIITTLRKSISSILKRDQYDKKATNDFIDKLFVEYFPYDLVIKSQEAKNTIHKKELDIMTQNLCILNIQENKHPKATKIKKELRRLRKISK